MSNVKVAVRVRPLSDREKQAGRTQCVAVEDNRRILVRNPKLDGRLVNGVGDNRERIKSFSFDQCYNSCDPDSPQYASQEVIFQDLGNDVLQAAFDGYNCSVLAFGQTGTGKSHTMMGSGYGDDLDLLAASPPAFLPSTSNGAMSLSNSFSCESPLASSWCSAFQSGSEFRTPCSSALGQPTNGEMWQHPVLESDRHQPGLIPRICEAIFATIERAVKESNGSASSASNLSNDGVEKCQQIPEDDDDEDEVCIPFPAPSTSLSNSTNSSSAVEPTLPSFPLQAVPSTRVNGTNFKVEASYYEIYNERVRDLLTPASAQTTSKPSVKDVKRNKRMSNIGSRSCTKLSTTGMTPSSPTPMSASMHRNQSSLGHHRRTDSRCSVTRASTQSLSEQFTLKVREHPVEGPFVQNLSTFVVANWTDVRKLLTRGNRRRVTASTHVHERSSRSHAVFCLKLCQAGFDQLATTPRELTSRLHLVDLAGSERAALNASKSRTAEGCSINKSLVTLGNVITALVELQSSDVLASNGSETEPHGSSSSGYCSSKAGDARAFKSQASFDKAKQKYIPYRDSVLTWLLKDSLGGSSKTVMIATVSSSSHNHAETINTLRYAQRAKLIRNTPVVNEDANVRLIRELREEIMRLKGMLVVYQQSHPSNDIVVPTETMMVQTKHSSSLTETTTSACGKCYGNGFNNVSAQQHIAEPGISPISINTEALSLLQTGSIPPSVLQKRAFIESLTNSPVNDPGSHKVNTSVATTSARLQDVSTGAASSHRSSMEQLKQDLSLQLESSEKMAQHLTRCWMEKWLTSPPSGFCDRQGSPHTMSPLQPLTQEHKQVR